MKYEIVNPSDPYEMDAEDETVAIAACLLLGEGFYGLSRDGVNVLGVVSFFPGATEALIAERFGGDLGAWLAASGGAVADALETVRMPDGRERSSINNIGGRARALAQAWREKAQP